MSREQRQKVKLVGLLVVAGFVAGAGVALRLEIANVLGYPAHRIGVTSDRHVDSQYFLCRYLNSCK